MYMEIVGCRAEDNSCPFRPPAMLFHGISGGHIQGIMEEMERRSKTEARLAKGAQLNGRDAVRKGPSAERAGRGGPRSRPGRVRTEGPGRRPCPAGGRGCSAPTARGLRNGRVSGVETSPLPRP